MVDDPTDLYVAGEGYTFGTITTPPIGDLFMEDRRGRMKFAPQDDMTPVESVRCAALFTRLITHGGDWREYIDRHGLQRHFVATETP